MHAARVRDLNALGQARRRPERIGSRPKHLNEAESLRARPVDARRDSEQENLDLADVRVELGVTEEDDLAASRADELGHSLSMIVASEPGVDRRELHALVTYHG